MVLKHNTSIISLFFIVSLLCACSAESTGKSNPSALSATPSQGKTPPTSEEKQSVALNGEAFELVVPCDDNVYGSGNQDGFYQIISNTDGSHNVVFIDYKTHQQIYLCADANCQHNNEHCSSWFPADNTQMWPVACDDQIFFVHNSWSSTSYIEKANLDGSNRQTLYELENGGTIDSGAAYKSGYLVLMVDFLDTEEDNVNHSERLIVINTETGEATTIFESNSPEGQATDFGAVSAFFEGVTEHGFIVKTIETGKTPDIQFHKVYEIPFDGSDMHEIASFQTGEVQGIPNGSAWYYLKSDDTLKQLQLGYIDTETGENHIVVSDLGKTIPTTTVGEVFIRNFVDEWIIINALTSKSLDENQNIELIFSCYAVNQNTGEIRELDLSIYYHATKVPIEIYDELGDALLVEASVSEVAPESQNQIMTGLEVVLGIINKEDYLASNPKYELINML